jgi:hypothetical protein
MRAALLDGIWRFQDLGDSSVPIFAWSEVY